MNPFPFPAQRREDQGEGVALAQFSGESAWPFVERTPLELTTASMPSAPGATMQSPIWQLQFARLKSQPKLSGPGVSQSTLLAFRALMPEFQTETPE